MNLFPHFCVRAAMEGMAALSSPLCRTSGASDEKGKGQRTKNEHIYPLLKSSAGAFNQRRSSRAGAGWGSDPSNAGDNLDWAIDTGDRHIPLSAPMRHPRILAKQSP
jgi:hypothetical protein